MLFPQLLIEELNNRRDDFRRFAESQSDELENYSQLLRELCAKPSLETTKILGDKDTGALPSIELDEFRVAVVRFEQRWQHHEAARHWAFDLLKDRTTFAADGSQILPGREISLPVAAIQIGTFENRHNERGEYRKQAYLKIVAPEDFYESDLLEEKPIRPETLVGLLRYEAEIERIAEFLQAKAGWQERGERAPLAFLDNTMLLSIALPQTNIQNRYVAKAAELVRLSEAVRVPVVGFVDQSYARDAVNLLDNFSRYSQNRLHVPSDRINDAWLFSLETLKNWGDRTVFFYSRRKNLSAFFTDERGESTVGFVYLKTSSDSVPARIDVPAWIFRESLLEEVIDTIRAECVIGLGYPYALETADATAVISTRDREIFLRALQDFARRENLNFRVANKKMSKARRR
jgi:hypothetical protein